MADKIKKSCIDQLQLSEPSFSRLGYDTNCLDERNKESSGPGMYRMNVIPPRLLNQPMSCQGYNTSNSGSASSNVDIESSFRGLGVLNSKCMTNKNDPVEIFRKMVDDNKSKFQEIEHKLCPVQSKSSKSSASVTSVSSDRFDFPTRDMIIQPNSYIGQNTRLAMKDNYAKQPKNNFKLPENQNVINQDSCYCFSGYHNPSCSLFKK